MQVFETHSLCDILLQRGCLASLNKDLDLLLLFGHIICLLERKTYQKSACASYTSELKIILRLKTLYQAELSEAQTKQDTLGNFLNYF